MDQTSSSLAGTDISPAMRLEFGDVRSMRTATSSQESSSDELFTSELSVPPNHQTLSDGDDDLDGVIRLRDRRMTAFRDSGSACDGKR